MLDDGEAQPRAALAGTAAVAAEEALEHMLLVGGVDAHAGVGNGEAAAAVGVLFQQGDDGAVFAVVLDGVVQKVVDQFAQHRGRALHGALAALHLDGYAALLRLGREARGSLLAQALERHAAAVGGQAVFIEAGEFQNVLHQLNEPRGLGVDEAGELAQFVLAGDAVLHDLGIAEDGGERRF